MKDKRDSQVIRGLDQVIIMMRNHFYSDHYRKAWTDHSAKMNLLFQQFESHKSELIERKLWQDYCDKRGLDETYNHQSVIDCELKKLKAWNNRHS